VEFEFSGPPITITLVVEFEFAFSACFFFHRFHRFRLAFFPSRAPTEEERRKRTRRIESLRMSVILKEGCVVRRAVVKQEFVRGEMTFCSHA
jgi:hypothetical protein